MARADEHLKNVRYPVERWHKDCMNSLREEPDSNESGYYCAWIVAPELDLQRLSLALGDCIQCFRSALDHLAFELATTFTSPMTEEIEKDSEFPILSDVDRHGNFGKGPDKWRVSGCKKVRGIDPAAQTIIEGLQPYKRGQTYHMDPLWWLGQLNNVDKHRSLHVTTRVLSGATFPVPGPNLPRSEWPRNVAAIGRSDGRPSIVEIGGDLAAKGRTRVARWPMLPIDPSKKMHMNFKPVLGVTFGSDAPLVGNVPVLEVLEQIRNHIISEVISPLKRCL